MAEYIERTKTAYLLCRAICGNDRDLCVSSPENCCQKRMKEFYEIPTADVAQVVHAQWKQISEPDEDGDVWYRCTACSSNDLHSPGIAVPYCWHCGAQMDADELQKGAD